MNLSISLGANPAGNRAIFSLFRETTFMLTHLFRTHPAKVGETYFEHMAFAFGFSFRLFRAALAALLHGVVPALCETTASSDVLAMNEEIRRRRAQMAAAE
jgi:hypothetical protein